MQEYAIKNSDLKHTEDLIKTSSSIYNLYQKLYELELQDKKNTIEYQTILDYLFIALEVEEKEYQKFFDSSKKSAIILDYIINTYNIEPLSVVDDILKKNNHNITLRRIMLDLSVRSIKNVDATNDLMKDDDADLLYMYGLSESEIQQVIDESYRQGEQMGILFEKEIVESFLILLQTYMNKKHNPAIYARLLKAKYDLSFVNKWLESLFLDTNFNVFNVLEPNGYVGAKSLGVDIDTFTQFKKEYNRAVCVDQIKEILGADIKQGSKPSIDLLLEQIYLKTGLRLLDDQSLLDLDLYVHTEYDDLDISNINQKIVDDAFTNTKKYKRNNNIK